MRGILTRSLWKSGLIALAASTASAAGQAPPASAEHETKAAPVVRTFGRRGVSDGGQERDEGDPRPGRPAPGLVARGAGVPARRRGAAGARRRRRGAGAKEIDKGRQAIKAARALLPTTSIQTTTKDPSGKVVYEDDRVVQDDRVALFEGMLHARTLAPIQDARRGANRVAGVRVVESEAISTEVTADLGVVDAYLGRAAKVLDDKKTDDAARALTMAQVRGVNFHYAKEDTPLAEAPRRDLAGEARPGGKQLRPGAGQPGDRPTATGPLPAGAPREQPPGRQPVDDRRQPARNAAPPGGEPDRQPRRTRAARERRDPDVGPDQRLVQGPPLSRAGRSSDAT